MAISPFILDYCVSLAPQFVSAAPCRILELGEGRTYLVDIAERLDQIAAAVGQSKVDLAAELNACRSGDPEDVPFNEAKLFYKWIFRCPEYMAADLGSRNPTFRIDLNKAFDLGTEFDVVINNGTTEHIFDQANVYRMIHQHTTVGGAMIHYTPGIGWINHGLYHVQPTFFFDLARSNQYEITSFALVGDDSRLELTDAGSDAEALVRTHGVTDALLCVCMRRTSDAPFAIPTQGCYL